VIEKLHWQNNHVYRNMNNQLGRILNDIGTEKRAVASPRQPERGATASMILGFLLMRIKQIMKQLKRQLVDQASVQGILEQVVVVESADDAEQGGARQYASTKTCLDTRTNQQQDCRVITRIAKSYKDCPQEYDSILEAIGGYFYNFKVNSDAVESIWLQILKFFEIQPPQSNAIFLKQHHAYYVEKVLDNRTLQLVMREAQRWRGTAHASPGLEELLADIE